MGFGESQLGEGIGEDRLGEGFGGILTREVLCEIDSPIRLWYPSSSKEDPYKAKEQSSGRLTNSAYSGAPCDHLFCQA